jgi:hypothetical protein
MKTVLEYSGMFYFRHGRNLQKLINYPTDQSKAVISFVLKWYLVFRRVNQ